jgi:hypothetical protein
MANKSSKPMKKMLFHKAIHKAISWIAAVAAHVAFPSCLYCSYPGNGLVNGLVKQHLLHWLDLFAM